MTTTEQRRVLLIHRYYWPDVAPYASILRAIGEHAAADGVQVEVLTAQPGYRGVSKERLPAIERKAGVLVRRISTIDEAGHGDWRKVANGVHFFVRILWRLAVGRYDVVVASTAPPFLLSSAAALGSKLSGTTFIYHVMDVHPEIGGIVGKFRNRLLFRFLRAIDKLVCQSAHAIVVLSDAMRDVFVVGERQTDGRKVHVLNNPMLPVFTDEISDQEARMLAHCQELNGIKLVFAGNMGQFQSLDALIEAVALLPPESRLHLFMFGSGREERRLAAKAKELAPGRIQFFGHVSSVMIQRLLELVDVGIVSVAENVDKYAFPSKIMNYIGAGRPVLAIGQHASPIHEFVERNAIGWAALQGDIESIVAALVKIEYGSEASDTGLRAHALYQEKYSLPQFLARWRSLLRGV